MTTLVAVVLSLAALVASALLTGILRRYAMRRRLLDVPNARSSHRMPTPRGGGAAFVVVFLAGLVVLVGMDVLPRAAAIGLGGAAGLVALVGFCDDHQSLPVHWRLLAHFLAAGWLLAWLGLPSLAGWPGGDWLVATVACLGLVWLLNLYNFMDGIDGIAAAEAVSVCLGMVALYLAGGEAPPMLPLLLLAAAVAGFLLWNLPPARIFMGDVGSGFLGTVLGGFVLGAAVVDTTWLWCWLILLGVFVVDASVTLLRRLLRGERLAQAHRSHAYQRAARHFRGHGVVTAGVVLINLAWLWPLALMVALEVLDGPVGLALGWLPLVVLAGWLRAGAAEPGD